MEKRSTHVRCGYRGRCKEYYGRRRRLMKVYAWRLEWKKTKRFNKQRQEGSYDSLDMLCDQMDWEKEWCWHTEMEGGGEDDQGENGWMRYTIHEVTGMKLVELRDVMAESKPLTRLVNTVAVGLQESTAP